MTTFERIDAALRAKGWRYDRVNELFMARERVDVISLVPNTTLDELANYQDDKYDHFAGRK